MQLESVNRGIPTSAKPRAPFVTPIRKREKETGSCETTKEDGEDEEEQRWMLVQLDEDGTSEEGRKG